MSFSDSSHIAACSLDDLNRTGATDVRPFSHLVRRHLASAVKELAEGLKDSDTVAAPGPTIFAHCDNSVKGALTVLENNFSGDELEKRKNSRWAIMNVWRPLVRPVTREPLALLDASTVDEKDLVGVMSIFPQKKDAAFGTAYPGGVGYVSWPFSLDFAHCSQIRDISNPLQRKSSMVLRFEACPRRSSAVQTVRLEDRWPGKADAAFCLSIEGRLWSTSGEHVRIPQGKFDEKSISY